MSNSGDKPNGLASDPLQRLASFKPPRDLSLGGVKPNKKIFTPNLNVARNKNKGPAVPNLQKKDEKGRRDRKNDRNNKNFKNGPNVIKSGGVFSEGLGSAERHSSGRFSYGRESDSTATLQRPTIRVKDIIKIDRELEEQKIKIAIGDNTILDDEGEDFKQRKEKDAPIKLPMDDGSWPLKPKLAVKVKQEVIVKAEPGADVDCAITSVHQKVMVDVKKELFEDTDVVNVLKKDQPTLILLQLPDCLPGRGGSADDDPRMKPVEKPSTSTGTSEADTQEPDNRCRLSDLEEGRIGKLLIHRSGRVTLALGDTKFEVCSGTKSAFHQEVVSLAVDPDSRSANLVALGAIQHKLNVVPDWEAMFHNISV